MVRIVIQICLPVIALLLTATGSIAAGCDTDPNECTLKKLCEVATAIDGENTIWSTEPSSEKHVSTAKNLDLKCGITPISDACDESPSDCKLKQLCGKHINCEERVVNLVVI